MKPSDKIWLEPECDECDERCWSCAPFDDCEECGKETIGYVRDDIVLASTAEASRMFDRIEKLEAGEIEFDRIIGDYASENARFRDRIEKLEAALREIIDIHPFKDPEGDASVKAVVDLMFHINLTARRALKED